MVCKAREPAVIDTPFGDPVKRQVVIDLLQKLYPEPWFVAWAPCWTWSGNWTAEVQVAGATEYVIVAKEMSLDLLISRLQGISSLKKKDSE